VRGELINTPSKNFAFPRQKDAPANKLSRACRQALVALRA
jgi:hypothetical protein